MIRLRPAEARGRFQNDWLDARLSFSFGNYRDAAFDGYSDLMVLNDDRVAPAAGFAAHPHEDVEVMSYPLAGAVEHRDSLGHHTLMRPGDVHLMRAGRGIVHSEMNPSSDEPEHHLQWWIRPATHGLPPAYAKLHVPLADKLDRWRLLASPDGADGSLRLAQQARVWAAVVRDAPLTWQPAAGRRTYLHVARGALALGGHRLAAGDAAFVEDEALLTLSSTDGIGAEVLRFELR
jgi:redox-sensitive bicupin YhaK (pirin superfamily)